MSKFNWIIVVSILLVFLLEYQFLNAQFERKSLEAVRSDFKTVVTGVSGLTSNFEYGSAITHYRVETLSRQMLRYNINYISEKIIGSQRTEIGGMADRVRQVMEGGNQSNFIILGLYDAMSKRFVLGEDYFKTASPLPAKGLEALISDAMVKEEAFKSFPLGNPADIFNRIDVFMRYNASAGVTVVGAIPRNVLKASYEDNVDISQLHSELMGNHSPENEGYIALYSRSGALLTTNWRQDGKERFLHDSTGQNLYDLMKNRQEEVVKFVGKGLDGESGAYYAYSDMSGDTMIVVVKDKSNADRHKKVVLIFLKIVTVLMLLLMFGLIRLVYGAKPDEELLG